jgi:hypothetical protein
VGIPADFENCADHEVERRNARVLCDYTLNRCAVTLRKGIKSFARDYAVVDRIGASVAIIGAAASAARAAA